MTEFWFFEVLRGHFFRDRNLDRKKRIRIWFRLYKDCVPIWGAVYLSENNANKTRPCAWTPSI